ncbi:DNA methylase N-4/N-6 domain protein [Oscillochloris trichoides DG-6]|uniref:Methyltransferase n=1 Tax=Oscillochloris trichoides DG-6 TaxID=765420 RepID=E1IBT1_9CHLR|nr:site-specific DNA-methyltransferase [Oscillochloris trichoides]EFO81347.1 DNA methylase N-4/N-6 domain protein [Oscillochloris trichoides DG-6]
MITISEQVSRYLAENDYQPLYIQGDSLDILKQLPCESVDMCMTSPPYWNKREYMNGGIGLEEDFKEYINNLLLVFAEIKRVLKRTGSFWLNIGDTYLAKGLVGLPWRIAIAMMDHQGWILRNDVIWNKIKGPDNTQDKLRNVHEYLFHFVKQNKGYYYDDHAIRSKPRLAQIKNGAVVSATGVTGVRYKRQIQLSTSLSQEEKEIAFFALNNVLEQVAKGEISDFRMVIRNQQRTTHSESTRLSGRAKELQQKGFYFLKYHPNGSKPGDVWEIIPEDTQGREIHYAAYPEDLCKIPILATCPLTGVVLDPFCGTGTTNLVAKQLFRKSIGIDIAQEYLDYAYRRSNTLL